MKLKHCNPNPFGLSLSKPSAGITRWTLRHGAFDKLSPLLRANGCCCQGERMFHASQVALRRHGKLRVNHPVAPSALPLGGAASGPAKPAPRGR